MMLLKRLYYYYYYPNVKGISSILFSQRYNGAYSVSKRLKQVYSDQVGQYQDNYDKTNGC